ncbi:MAG: hypothetical protein LBD24_09630 [Spirochaetaceae bacterium]|jgi:hypothetical protein|nr:hypothetical protein [Spirochaetaceae bacterium]
MRWFCLLWVPLFYLFWSAVAAEGHTGAKGILALSLGSIVALAEFFLGAFVEPGGFGADRWASGFVDIVAVPVLLPFAVFLLLLPLRLSRDFASFALLWLIPDLAIRLVSWSASNNPLLLIIVPLLRTALGVGVSFCLNLMMTGKASKVMAGFLGIPLLSFTGTTSYWAYFCQDEPLGRLFLALTFAPALAAVAYQCRQARAPEGAGEG